MGARAAVVCGEWFGATIGGAGYFCDVQERSQYREQVWVLAQRICVESGVGRRIAVLNFSAMFLSGRKLASVPGPFILIGVCISKHNQWTHYTSFKTLQWKGLENSLGSRPFHSY